MSWKTLPEIDHLEWKLKEADPCDKVVWRSNVRSAMHAASQLPGGEAHIRSPLMWTMFLHLHVNLNASDDDDDDDNDAAQIGSNAINIH